MTLIFTYGTLQREFNNHHIMQEAKGKFITKAKLIHHDIYYAYRDSFPAVIKGKGTVFGEVFEISDKPLKIPRWDGGFEKILPVTFIDRLEGYNPDNPKSSMYIRKKAKVITPNGKELWVRVYIWNRPVDSKLKIESGSWAKDVSLRRERR